MQKLKLPAYSFRITEKGQKRYIFDEFRKRWIVLTPEEWVRQHFMKYLASEKHFPPALMAIEKKVTINGLPQRFDLVIYNRKGNPLVVAEFKAPGVEISQTAFDQAIRYNSVILAPFFLVSNGMNHFVCQVNYEEKRSVYIREVPDFNDIGG
jgi:hypothetical protein